jgi:hypothetical protein
MATKRLRDLCGLYCVAEFSNYNDAEFFMYLIGAGASRSRYELTAHHRKTRRLLFDLQVDASAPALEARARKAGTDADAQAVPSGFQQARPSPCGGLALNESEWIQKVE